MMDPTTIIGMVLGMVLIVVSIMQGGTECIKNFSDPGSAMIVIGGTIAAVIASYPLQILKDVPKHFKVLVKGNQYNIPELVDQLVDLAMVARQKGLLALEEKADEIEQPFFKQSVLMIVDANDPDKVREALEKEMESMMVRHDQAAGLYEKGSAYAPAFGMIGTLVGLINMLKGLDPTSSSGASNIGQDMSVALITTFYGSVMSNLFFHPIAKKLRIRQDEEELYCETIVEGILAIQAGENPKYIRERLLSSLKRETQEKLGAGDGSPGGDLVEEK